MCVVGVLEQVVGFKDVVGLHPILGDGLDEVANVLQLVPVLGGLIDLLHGAWLELIDELAKNDAIFEAVHEVVADAAPCHPLDPLSKLLLLLVVILLGQLPRGPFQAF